MLTAAPAAVPGEILERPHRLARAPVRVVADGVPVAGLYAGAVGDARFEGLPAPYPRGFLERRLVEKRWQYALIATDQVMIALAIADLGYLSTGFCAFFDRGARRLLLDEHAILPPGCATIADAPGLGLSARLVGPGVRAGIERNGDRIQIAAQWGRGRLEASLDAAGALPPLSAISPLGPGRFNFTQKLVGARVEGAARIGSATFQLGGGSCGLDFTHGFLERETAWRWAFASGTGKDGRRVAFNFSDGFNDAGLGENAVWIDGAPLAVGPVSFGWDARDPMQSWTVAADGGAAELRFTPEGARSQNIDLKLVATRYLQPFGTFDGFVMTPEGEKVEIRGLAGVTEDHAARW